MKKSFSLLLFIVCHFAVATFAQNSNEGMNFEHLPSIESIFAKAKKENKLVFIDCYTTWCGPCKMMSKNVFTQKEVGDFYNANFVNLKIQLDTTDKDDDYVKSWHKDGSDIAKKYEVRAFPTYLIFNSNGEILHRFVGSMSAEAFIDAGKKLLDPENQYYTQVRKYENGDKSPQHLLKLAKLAHGSYDKNAKLYTDEYLATQTDLYTKDNLELLFSVAKSSKDKGFQIALNEPEKVDKILESPKKSYNLVKRIILNEELGGMLRKLGKDGVPDFNAFDENLKSKYPAYADYVSAFSKMYYYRTKKNWEQFAKYTDELIKSEEPAAADLNNYAWALFENTADKTLLEKAANWSKLSLKKDDNATFIDTHANILYKLGNVKEGIAEEKRAMEVAKKTNGDVKWCADIIAKMEKGEPTWPIK